MNIKRNRAGLQIALNSDEAFEILQALESHKRKLGRVVQKARSLQERDAAVLAYNSVEKMIDNLSNASEIERKSRPYTIK